MKSLIIALVAALLAILPWPGQILPVLAVAVYLLLLSWLLGKRFGPSTDKLFNFLFGLMILLSLLMLTTAAAFYLWRLDGPMLIGVTLFPCLILLIPRKKTATETMESRPGRYWSAIIPTVLYLVCFGWLTYIFSQHATTEPLSSLWLIIPTKVFVLYFLSTAILIGVLVSSRFPIWLKIFLTSLHYFISLGLVILIFPLGFGFDPFIHQATEKIIYLTGTVSPKPFYYIGQYGLIVWLTTFTRLPIPPLDAWLLPLLSAVFLPATIFYCFRCNFNSEPRALALLPLLVLILPNNFLIQTTPQGLSLLWSLLIIFLSLFYIHHQQIPAWLLILLALASLTLHPLSGIPMMIYVIMLIIYHRVWEARNVLRWLRLSAYGILAALAALALPAIFALQSHLSSLHPVRISVESTSAPLQLLTGQYFRFIRWEDFIYLLQTNQRWLSLALALIGIWYVIKRRRTRFFINYLITFIILIINYLLLQLFIRFDYLIAYERNSYPERISALALLFLWPFILITGYWLGKKILQHSRTLGLIAMIFLSLLLTTSWYLTYPRFDYYDQSKGYNTSRYDFEAVNWIEKNAAGRPYVVLANQSVSAAAVSTFGFSHYYQSHFYYPIPTGDKLYESYLDATYNRKAMTSIIGDVKALTGVPLVYVIINDYWSGFTDSVERLKTAADATQAIAKGRSYIFTFSAR